MTLDELNRSLEISWRRGKDPRRVIVSEDDFIGILVEIADFHITRHHLKGPIEWRGVTILCERS